MQQLYFYVGVTIVWVIIIVVAVIASCLLFYFSSRVFLTLHFLKWVHGEATAKTKIKMNWLKQFYNAYGNMVNYNDATDTIRSKKGNIYNPPKFWRQRDQVEQAIKENRNKIFKNGDDDE